MKRMGRWATLGALLAACLTGGADRARAQAPAAQQHQQVVSANPFGLLLEVFNAEYERAVGQSSTAGLGGSFLSNDGDDYLNADLFWRFYPNADPLDGWAFGLKAGLTNVPDDGTFFGAGFDVNRSWLLGVKDNFYVGIGFGLKRLIGAGDAELGLDVIPTFRIVNVGVAF
jgi:hypothetical protein